MGYIFRLSFVNLKIRKFRTILTIVGIMIGTMSIVSMLTAGMGAKSAMLDEIEKMENTKNIRVTAISTYRKDMILTDSVVSKFMKLDDVDAVYPILTVTGQERMGEYFGWNNIIGVPVEYFDDMELSKGEIPEYNGSRPKLLAGKGFGDSMYNIRTWTEYSKSVNGSVSFVGKRIDFKVDSAMDSMYTEMATDTDAAEEDDYQMADDGIKLGIVGENTNEYDFSLYTDIDTLKLFLKRISKDDRIPGQPVDKNGQPYGVWVYDTIIVRADSINNVEHLSKVIKDMGYEVNNSLEDVRSVNKTIGMVQMILGAIGSIAAIVAVIGIINTMMTAVYDRVKEIGLLKMLGADSDDISIMFLFEAAVLGLMGGALGVGLSFLINLYLNKKLVLLMELPKGSWIMDTPLWLIVLAIVLSIVVSVLAGTFPARWASKIKPLEAITT